MRSSKRRKTVQARQVGEILRISIPAAMSTAEETKWVDEMVKRMQRKASTERFDLAQRAAALASRYGLKKPDSIVWVDNQEWRWGSCTPADRTVRISSRLGKEPAWVVDYVIVHELAHLSVRAHNRAFWDLVERYPLTERARGFLIARGRESDDSDEAGGDGQALASGPPVDGPEQEGPDRDEPEDRPDHPESGVPIEWASEPGRYPKRPGPRRTYQPERLFA